MIVLAIFAALQIGDIYTTLKVLNQGGRELNPIMNKLFTKFGALQTLVATKAALVGACYAFIDVPYVTEVLWALCVFYAGLVFHNFRQIKPRQDKGASI